VKQIFQNLRDGRIALTDVPCPHLQPGHLLLQSQVSLVSAGTERTLVEFGKANPIEKMRQQPDKVRMVWNKIRADGILPTVSTVMSRLDRPLPMGYCNAGAVLAVGLGVAGFRVGNRVASNGPHAEVVCVPSNLCARIPDEVTDENAAFTVVGAIALQGVRLAQPTLGECFMVIGLGLIGLMTVQILKAHGSRVLGADFDQHKLELARQFGAETVDLSIGEDPIAQAIHFTRGRGVDGVLITAATKSSEPVHQAAQVCRKRGRIVLVGVAGLQLSRQDFYEKELSFQISCSYGPGRYDPTYEQLGHDYPIGHVRWTAQRNFEAILDMMADGRLAMKPLVSHRFDFARAEDAYGLLTNDEPCLGMLLRYANCSPTGANHYREQSVTVNPTTRHATLPISAPVAGVIGAGNYACGTLIPALKKTGIALKTVASLGGSSCGYAARKFGFQEATTKIKRVINDEDINVLVIATRHDSHAQLVCEAMQAGKHVYVEKPLAVNRDQLKMVGEVYQQLSRGGNTPVLMVGFNRRFAPHAKTVRALLGTVHEPKCLVYTVNAGAVPSDHWLHDPAVGGGRVVGEMCHFIDLLRFLIGHPAVSIQVAGSGKGNGSPFCLDSVSATGAFPDGSSGTIHYFVNGHKSFPKERLDVFCAGKVLQLTNFRKLKGFGWRGFSNQRLWRQDKGNMACTQAFVQAVREGKANPIPFEELVEVTKLTFDVNDALALQPSAPIGGRVNG